MQNIVIYPGAILELQTTLMNIKKHKVFLVTGNESFEKCGAKEKLQWLFNAYDVIHFYGFKTNPDSYDVIKGVQLFNLQKCEIIISVGGGSVIDMAKLINYYHKSGIETLEEYNIKNNNPTLVTHISLPTTAGSGAEATHFAVMYIGKNKYSVAHPHLIPNFVIIDTELHYSQSPYQKAVSGVDALAQSIESLWSVESTEESRLYSEIALKLIWNYLPNVVYECSKLAHMKLAVGANFAGRAINIAKTTAPHAFSYGFTKLIGLPHGHAVALTLPFFVNLHLNVTAENCADTRGISHVLKQLSLISEVINSDLDNLENALISFLNWISIDTSFIQLGISKDVFLEAIKYVDYKRLANNPVKIDFKKTTEIYNFCTQKLDN